MTIQASFEIECPQCHVKQATPVWDSVNVDENPELKERLFKGEINLFHCLSCSHAEYLEVPLLYHDMQRQFLVWYFPLSSIEDKAFLDDFTEHGVFFTKEMSQLKEDLAERYQRTHIVFDMAEMVRYILFREKLYEKRLHPEDIGTMMPQSREDSNASGISSVAATSGSNALTPTNRRIVLTDVLVSMKNRGYRGHNHTKSHNCRISSDIPYIRYELGIRYGKFHFWVWTKTEKLAVRRVLLTLCENNNDDIFRQTGLRFRPDGDFELKRTYWFGLVATLDYQPSGPLKLYADAIADQFVTVIEVFRKYLQ